jgi:hypothetical protein
LPSTISSKQPSLLDVSEEEKKGKRKKRRRTRREIIIIIITMFLFQPRLCCEQPSQVQLGRLFNQWPREFRVLWSFPRNMAHHI